MAGIEKMHMTKDQFYTFCEWFINHYRINDQGQEIFDKINWQDILKDGVASFNFSERTDKYLMKHCKLKFVQKRLKEQY
jgi:hypothetical protein